MDVTPYGKNRQTVQWWSENRNKIEDLYPSEKYYFCERVKHCESVADIGCAAGGFSEVVAGLNDAASYIGIDVSPNLIERAQQSYTAGKFLQYDGEILPREVRNVDMCFSFGVLHHVHRWASLVEQMIAASKKHVCFDLRLTKAPIVDGVNLQDSFQKIEFGGVWDGETTIPYIVLSETDTIQTVSRLLPSDAALHVYGYEARPNKVVVTPFDTVTMASFCIDLNSAKPGVTLEIKV